MTPEDDQDLERHDDDTIAAEYVLGVLPARERQETARRIERDAAYARQVEAWEARLAPLADTYTPVEPPAALKQRIDAALFGREETEHASPMRFLDSLWLWRGLAAASLLVALALGALFLSAPPAAPPSPRLVASLSHEESDISAIAFYDAAANEIVLARLGGDRPPESDFELWVIEGENAPVSLGVFEDEADIRLGLAGETEPLLRAGSLLAISVEPVGGSPTGQPTGPVVALGDLRAI